MTREEIKHITDLCFNVPVATRRFGEERTYYAEEIAEAKKYVMDMLEQKPCEDCISRADAIKALKELKQEDLEAYGCKVWGNREVDEFTSVQAEVKQGRWKHKHDDRNDWLECPFCGYGDEGEVRMDQGTAFCPFCGARLTRWDEGWML